MDCQILAAGGAFTSWRLTFITVYWNCRHYQTQLLTSFWLPHWSPHPGYKRITAYFLSHAQCRGVQDVFVATITEVENSIKQLYHSSLPDIISLVIYSTSYPIHAREITVNWSPWRKGYRRSFNIYLLIHNFVCLDSFWWCGSRRGDYLWRHNQNVAVWIEACICKTRWAYEYRVTSFG